MRVEDLAGWLNGTWEGDGGREIIRVASIEEAREDEAAFASGNALKHAPASRAGCLLVLENYTNSSNRTIIRTRDPRAAAAQAILKLQPPLMPPPGVHPSAVIGPGAEIAGSSSIGPNCVIGGGTRIGEQCIIYPQVTIYPGATIGNRVIIHSGTVIGADGFGFVPTNGRWEKFPQVGRVEIGDDVEIGANCCIDRAALGGTSIGEGTKLDNMVHIAHNCRIGRHVVIAAQTGLSGGVVVEDYAVIGGQVGIGDKARIESRAVLGSGSGVLTSKIVRAGQVMWGTPARPLKQYLAQLAALSRFAKKHKED